MLEGRLRAPPESATGSGGRGAGRSGRRPGSALAGRMPYGRLGWAAHLPPGRTLHISARLPVAKADPPGRSARRSWARGSRAQPRMPLPVTMTRHRASCVRRGCLCARAAAIDLGAFCYTAPPAGLLIPSHDGLSFSTHRNFFCSAAVYIFSHWAPTSSVHALNTRGSI